MMLSLLLVGLLLPLATCIDRPTITTLSPKGVRFEITDMGYTLVAVHYSVNKKVPGVQAGDYNYDIHTKINGKWIHENNAISLHPHDYIAYWVYGIVNGQGQQLLDQEWIMKDSTTQPTQSAPAPATSAPVTSAPAPAISNSDSTTQPTEPATSAPATSAPATSTPATSAPATSAPTPATSAPATSAPATSATTPPTPAPTPAISNSNSQSTSCATYPCLIFEDNFDFINHKIWEHEKTLGGGGNWEFEYYTNNRSNSYCKNGVLYLKPTLTTEAYGDNFLEAGSLDIWGTGPYDTCTGNAFYGCKRNGAPGQVINPIQSAKLRSSRGFNVKYGKVEVEAKLPTGDWIWPAIWMMPTYDNYGGWPSSGEIDIMESRGNLGYRDSRGQPAGVDHVGSTLHFGPNWQHDAWPKATASKNLNSGTFGEKFYRYGVEWDDDFIKFTVNDEEILNVTSSDGGFWKYGGFDQLNMQNPWRYGTKMAPFDQEFYIIMNVAVGGLHYFSDSDQPTRPKPWKDTDSNAATLFWRAKDEWYPTWNPHINNGEDAALQINYVKVWKMKD